MNRIFIQSWILVCIVATIWNSAFGKKNYSDVPYPDQLVIARHTFFDFGPPFDFYDLFLVRSAKDGSSIERISLTPQGGSCMQPASVEVATGLLDKSVAVLLGKSNPCTIPDKELIRELKRCKKCAVFSGSNVSMQVQCENRVRIIHANILDRDMYDPAPQTPEHTSWTMQLLNRLDQAVDPGPLDRPILPTTSRQQSVPPQTPDLADIGAGKYDILFQGTRDRPSDLYRKAQLSVPSPDIQVIFTSPIKPDIVKAPVYPPIARLARIEGKVSIKFEINVDGSTRNLEFENGPQLLRAAVAKAVGEWKFLPTDADKQITSTIEFKANCASQ